MFEPRRVCREIRAAGVLCDCVRTASGSDRIMRYPWKTFVVRLNCVLIRSLLLAVLTLVDTEDRSLARGPITLEGATVITDNQHDLFLSPLRGSHQV